MVPGILMAIPVSIAVIIFLLPTALIMMGILILPMMTWCALLSEVVRVTCGQLNTSEYSQPREEISL